MPSGENPRVRSRSRWRAATASVRGEGRRTGAGVGARAEIGVIGGSGFYGLDALEDAERVEVETPFGAPSAAFEVGALAGRRVAFLARHGEGHRLTPAEAPSRANVWALKALGVGRVLSISAVGSLREEIAPLHAVVPGQLIDRTRGQRPSSFFGEGVVAHVGFADPFCPRLAAALADAAEASGATTHRGGALVVIEGPAFSTRAESALHRAWGGAIVGMTALPEAKLAREAELCYAALCFVTDWDVWREAAGDVSAELVLRNLRANAGRGREAVARAVAGLGDREEDGDGGCGCGDALATALITPPEAVPAEARRRLGPLLDRYLGPPDGGGGEA